MQMIICRTPFQVSEQNKYVKKNANKILLLKNNKIMKSKCPNFDDVLYMQGLYYL